MKKLVLFILTLVTFSFIISSCEDTETYADKLKKEKKSIKRLLSDSSYYITEEYPKNRAFNEKEFYKDPRTGVFFHVVDSGNGNRPSETEKTFIRVRYKWGYFFQSNDTAQWENSSMATFNDQINFRYNDITSQTATYSEYYNYGYSYSSVTIRSVGLAAPLDYVGENAIVKIIIPFSTGSYVQQTQNYEPLYIGYVRYEFIPE